MNTSDALKLASLEARRAICVSLHPGWVRTERQVTKWLTPEGDKQRLEAQCLKRWVEPEDIARFCVFLASDDASACTAQHYVVDAGWV